MKKETENRKETSVNLPFQCDTEGGRSHDSDILKSDEGEKGETYCTIDER